MPLPAGVERRDDGTFDLLECFIAEGGLDRSKIDFSAVGPVYVTGYAWRTSNVIEELHLMLRERGFYLDTVDDKLTAFRAVAPILKIWRNDRLEWDSRFGSRLSGIEFSPSLN